MDAFFRTKEAGTINVNVVDETIHYIETCFPNHLSNLSFNKESSCDLKTLNRVHTHKIILK